MTIQSIVVSHQSTQLHVKFSFTVNVTTIANDCFELWTASATPTKIASPFRTIDTYNDYDSIGRILTLYMNVQLSPSTDYELRTAHLQNASGITQSPDSEVFTTSVDTQTPTEPVADPVEIIDHSVVTASISDPGSILFVPGENSNPYVVDTDPNNGEVWLEEDYHSGRVTITFSANPLEDYVNSTYFKAQRRPIGRGMVRWENLSARVTGQTDSPTVFVDFPSHDATPLYNSPDSVYFETGYKYRVRVSRLVGF